MTHTWICDTCSDPINSVDDGWVEWLTGKSDKAIFRHGFRLVHSHGTSKSGRSCQYDEDEIFKKTRETIGDLPLSEFVGPDGLMTLLEYMSEDCADPSELVELTKRIQIPSYDRARAHTDIAISAGVFEPNSKPGFYTQDQLQRTLRWVAQQQE